MTDLDKLLDSVQSPEPSDLLKARILREARSLRPAEKASETAPANDRAWTQNFSVKKWGAVAALALVFGVVGFSTMSPTSTVDQTDYVAEAADTMGYDELYAWVQGEDGDANKEGANEASTRTNTLPA